MSRTITQDGFVESSSLANEVMKVYSDSGFSAGDLVYNVNGSYGTIPDNFTSTATFTLNANQATVTGGVTGGYIQLVEGNNVGALNGKAADKLSNGNVVVAWIQGTFSGRTIHNLYFKILDINNNEVVAPTIISSSVSASYRTFAQISVAALTGGGFAIAWRNTNNRLMTAVYSNAGVQVSAPLEATTVTMSTGFSSTNIVSLTNGGFAAAYWNNDATNLVEIQFYDSVGAYINKYQVASSVGSWSAQIGLASRLNGSTHELCYITCGATNWLIGTINATTVATINVSYTATGNSSTRSADVCVNSTNNDFVIAELNGTNGSGYYTLNTSGTLSSRTSIESGAAEGALYLKALSSGGFAIFMPNGNSGYIGALYVGIYNGSYVKQTSTWGWIKGTFMQYYPGLSIIEHNNVLYGYQSQLPGNGFNSVGYSTNTYYGYLYRFAYSLTTLKQIPISNINNSAVGSATLPANGYVKASSVPSNAVFYASASSTQNVTYNNSSGSSSNYVKTQTVIDSTYTALYMDSDTLANGNTIVTYFTSGGSSGVLYAVYNQAGTLVTNGSVVSPLVGGVAADFCGVAALPNGKAVVIYYNASSVLSYVIYSSTFTVLASGTFSFASISTAADQRPAITALADNRFAIVWSNGSNSQVSVFDDTGASVATLSNISGGTPYGLKIAGRLDGGFAVAWNVASTFTAYVYAKTGATSYAQVANVSIGVGGAFYSVCNSMVCLPDGHIVANVFTATGTSKAAIYPFQGTGNTPLNDTSTQSTTNSSSNVGVSITGTGTAVAYFTGTNNRWLFPQIGGAGNALSTGTSQSNASPTCVTMTPGADNQIFLFLRNSSSYPSFAILNAFTDTYVVPITAGSTPSNGVTLNPTTNRTALIGVANTSCPAGGVGLVQINGYAQLNASYPSGTANQAFDFEAIPDVFGVKGYISGRNVTMTKG